MGVCDQVCIYKLTRVEVPQGQKLETSPQVIEIKRAKGGPSSDAQVLNA